MLFVAEDGVVDGESVAASRSPALPGMGRVKLALGSIAFLALTIGIFWYQFARIQAGDAGPRWSDLRWGYLALILLCLPIETLAAGTRMWVVARALQPGLTLWTCIKAEWANVALNLLTPSHAGGGPGQIYMLTRERVRAGTALTISLLGFLGTMIGLLAMGAYSLLVSDLGHVGPLFGASVSVLTSLSAAMLLGAVWPSLLRRTLGTVSRALWWLGGRRLPMHDWWPPASDRTGLPMDRLDPITTKLVDLVYTYRDDVRRFLRVGKASFGWACLLSFGFLFSRAFLAYLCVRFLGIDASTWRHVMDVQIALIFVIFFAPTPGGAGLAEGASLILMSAIVPGGFVPYYNLLWRFSTAYLGALAGLTCLARALMQDVRLSLGMAVRPTSSRAS